MFYGTTVQLSFIWQQDKLAANAAHIQKAASNLLERIVKVSGLLGKLRNGLVTSINGFNEFSSQYENSLMDDARALHELGVSVSNELSTPSPITENMRKLKGTEDIIDVEPVDELDQ
jgi:DNA anti-recombination protein RmuC